MGTAPSGPGGPSRSEELTGPSPAVWGMTQTRSWETGRRPWVERGGRLTDVPDHVTHYHLADKAPFLNLSDLTEGELSGVMGDLHRRRKERGVKRVFGARYMELR